jgi:hypothetical protein
MMGLGLILLIVFIIFLLAIGIYIYTSFALMRIAEKTNTEPSWLAWIPIANMVLLAKIAMMHWWPVLLYAPAFLFMIIGAILGQFYSVTGIIFMVLYYLTILALSVFLTIWYWKMFVRVGRPGWWSLVPMIGGVVAMIFMLIPTTVTMVLGAIIALAGTAFMLIFLGMAAWGNAPVPIVKKKTNRK